MPFHPPEARTYRGRHLWRGLAVLLVLAPAVAGAQEARDPEASIRFRHLGPADGLSHPDVHALHQDAKGFLWFGTEDGLTRYDGVSLRVYRSAPFDTTSLPHAWTVAMADAASGGLWLAGERGTLSLYDPGADAFSVVAATSRAEDLWTLLVPANDGPLWLGGRTRGLYCYTPSSRTLDTFANDPGDPASLVADQTTALLGASGGGVWVGTQRGGLDLWRPDLEGFQHHRHDPGTATSLPSDYVTALFRDREDRLWVGTHEGLASYDRGRFYAPEALRGDVVWSILQDPEGALWLGTSNGLVRYDPASGDATRHAHDPADPTSLSEGDVRALLLDRSGVLWAATESGLSYFTWAPPPFEHVAPGEAGVGDSGVWAFLMARDGTLWVGSESSLDRFEPDGTVTHYRHAPGDAGTLSPGWVMSLHEDADGSLWVGTRNYQTQPGALHRFDPATGRVVERFVQDPSDPASLPSDNPWGLFEDSQRRLWVLSGGSGCPSLFDRAARTFTPFCLEDGGERTTAKKVVERPDGSLLFATWGNGLARLDPASGEATFLHHDPADPDTPPSDFISTIHADARGALWLGTYGSGFARFDPPEASGETGTFTHYATATSGLPNDVIYAIETDARGDVWLSTNAGLTRFSPASESFQTFGLDDGVQDLEFNAVVSHRAASGELFFGGINGFNRFVPERLTRGGTAPPVVITDVRVNGQPLAPEANGPLEVAAPYAERVRLGSRQRDVAFSFAALDYGAPERTRYRVQLEGYDDDWREPGAARTATYTNLDPGTYTFRVQAAGADGVWGETGAALPVSVAPRFFEAWWFQLLGGLALVGLLGVTILARERQRRENEQHLEAQVAARTEDLRAEQRTTVAQAERLREMDRLKTRFFTNVSHEFRTPLTLTIGPLEDLEAESPPLAPEAARKVDLALRNSRRLLRLINQLLDVARLDAGEMRLHAHDLDLGHAVRVLALSFAPLAERRGVRFEIETPEAPVWATADPEKLEHIVVNLLSNAFKFTPEGGAIRVEVASASAPEASGEAGSGETEIRVRDSGPGIPEADLPHLFDRFYQTDETVAGGSGIGLALAHDLARLHGGSIHAESTEGFGSLFVVRLPAGHPAETPQFAMASGDAPTSLVLGNGAASGEAPHAEEESPEPVEDDRTTVLVADDNADIRAYVRVHLEAQYRVIEAADGEEALALARAHLPDLIVSDVMMPKLDGVGLVRALRADRETDFIPVLLLTAKAEETDKVAGLDAGADAYVVKPFNVRTLAARIENLIASRQRLRERFAAALASPAPGETAVTPDVPLDSNGAANGDVDAAFVARAREAVEARLGDETFSVADLTDALGQSRSTLHRRLKDATGDAPTGFIRHIRLEHAATLLADARGSVSEVAYAVGFKSVSHFSQVFRAKHGVSPSGYADTVASGRSDEASGV